MLELLLYGSKHLSFEVNNLILTSTTKQIFETERFAWRVLVFYDKIIQFPFVCLYLLVICFSLHLLLILLKSQGSLQPNVIPRFPFLCFLNSQTSHWSIFGWTLPEFEVLYLTYMSFSLLVFSSCFWLLGRQVHCSKGYRRCSRVVLAWT